MKLALVALLAVGLTAQTISFPASPRGEFAKRYVDAFNAGEPAMKAFLESLPAGGPPVADRLTRYRQARQDLGPIVPLAPPREVPDGIEIVSKNSHGESVRLTLVIPGPPLTLGGMRAEPADMPREETPAGPPLDERGMTAAVASLVASRLAADAFTGTVLIGRGASIVWESAYGPADRATQRPNRMTTRFDVGSIAKLFTRIAIAQLGTQGKVQLGDTVGKFLPDYPNETVRRDVTIGELLDMHSGIGDFFGPKFSAADRSKIRSLQDYVPLFASDPLLFKPGAGEAYSNGGYIVLGLIVEAITHESYYDYVQTRIFAPAGMKDTAFGFRDAPAPETAVGYTKHQPAGSGAWASNLDMMPARGSSAGSFQSTAEDFLRFADALARGVILSADAAERFGVHPGSIGIAGGAPGLNAEFDTGVGSGYTLVVLANLDPPSAESVGRDIRAILRRVR